MTDISTSASTLSVVDVVDALRAPRFWRRLFAQPAAVVCVAYLAALTAVAILAPLLMPWVSHEQAGNLLASGQGPSGHHLLGTDSLGRDELERLAVGTRVTLEAVIQALAVYLMLGVPFGLIAGYFGGAVERIVGWVGDLTFAVPTLILLLVVLSVFTHSTLAAMITLGAASSPYLMRVVRSATLPLRDELYIAAARVSGLSRPYIITRHVLPRIAGPIIVQASLFSGASLLTQSGLAFLGILDSPPAPSWGRMLDDGIQNIVLHPWLIWPPGVAIALTVLAFGLFGDAVRDASTESWQGSRVSVATRSEDGPAVRLWRRGARTRPGGRVASRSASSSRAPRRPGTAVPRALEGVGGDREPLLSLRNLSVAFPSKDGEGTSLVEDVTFEVERGQIVGIVGESGCGKTVTAMAILGVLPGDAFVSGGEVRFDGQDLVKLSERELLRIRGKEIGLVSQQPMVGLNPSFRVGWQLADCLRIHRGLSRGQAKAQVFELLERVRLPDPAGVARLFPHELSGGMAQRVAIARALTGNPKLLIADEPTTALDVTVQAEILDLLRSLAETGGMSVLLVTHDWGVVADMCERVVVMYGGQVVERAGIGSLFRQPLHPYTEALLASNPIFIPESKVLPTIPGTVPTPGAWPHGCHFHPRCAYATDACAENAVGLMRPDSGRETRCIHHEKLVRA